MFPYCLSIVGTSDGTQTHLNDPVGGHCNDTKNGIFMKIEVYVCKKSNLTYTGNVQLHSVIKRSAEVQCTHTVHVHAMLTTCKKL